MKTLTYKSWTFEVDFARTREAYSQTPFGSPEGCECHPCKNFIAARDQVYPEEIKDLLRDLGIDYRKESEVYHMARLEDGLHYFGGWFHFKGRILAGKDCRVGLPGGGSTFETEPVTDRFAIGFMKGNGLHFFSESEKEDLIQVEFLAKVGWVREELPEAE